jgi:hypothetical protein
VLTTPENVRVEIVGSAAHSDEECIRTCVLLIRQLLAECSELQVNFGIDPVQRDAGAALLAELGLEYAQSPYRAGVLGFGARGAQYAVRLKDVERDLFAILKAFVGFHSPPFALLAYRERVNELRKLSAEPLAVFGSDGDVEGSRQRLGWTHLVTAFEHDPWYRVGFGIWSSTTSAAEVLHALATVRARYGDLVDARVTSGGD